VSQALQCNAIRCNALTVSLFPLLIALDVIRHCAVAWCSSPLVVWGAFSVSDLITGRHRVVCDVNAAILGVVGIHNEVIGQATAEYLAVCGASDVRAILVLAVRGSYGVRGFAPDLDGGADLEIRVPSGRAQGVRVPAEVEMDRVIQRGVVLLRGPRVGVAKG